MHMDYCMEHPEELTKVAAVQKKVCVTNTFQAVASWRLSVINILSSAVI